MKQTAIAQVATRVLNHAFGGMAAKGGKMAPQKCPVRNFQIILGGRLRNVDRPGKISVIDNFSG